MIDKESLDDTGNESNMSTPLKGEEDGRQVSVSPSSRYWEKLEDGGEVGCNRILPGTSCSQNKDSISFGQEGCIAYGCRNLVVVVESSTAQVIQTLHKHKYPVLRTAWAISIERCLGLASADSAGHIIIWDLDTGESVRNLHDGSFPVTDIRWLDARIAKTGNLLLAVHSPNNLILWNTWTGSKLWKYTSTEATILSLDMDPFNTNRLLLLSPACALMISDFQPTKPPAKEPSKFYILKNKGGSPGRTFNNKDAASTTSSNDDRRMSDARETKLSKVMRQMVLGDSRMNPSNNNNQNDGGQQPGQSLSAIFHACMRDVIILTFNNEISLLDTKLGQVICSINLDRIHSPVVSTYSCSVRDAIFVLHESGSVSVWRRKPVMSVLATPAVVTRSFSMLAGLSTVANNNGSTANHRNSVVSMDTSFETAGSDLILEVGYDSRVQSEHVRMGKNSRVLGLAVHPVNQEQVSFLTSDGRIYVLEYDDGVSNHGAPFIPAADTIEQAASANQKLSIRSVIGSNSGQLTRIKMCPTLTVKNEKKYRPLLAAAARSGNILIYNAATGKLEREICVHTSPIIDLEWISDAPAVSVISCSHSSVTGSNLVKNELIHTNIITGKTKVLRGERGDEPKITMIRVSSALQFFVLAFSSGPFELWDAVKLTLLRTMPKKFPHVSAISWSPTHRSKKKNSASPENKTPSDSKSIKAVSLKEHILFSDLDSQLFHFSVEGNSIRDGSKIPAETGLGVVNTMTCKGDLIVRGDTEGNINVWNIKARQSKNIHTGRGNIKMLKFVPGGGKSNLKLLAVYTDGLAIWDLKEMDIINELKSPRVIPEIESADWISSSHVCVLCTDGSIFTMGLALVTTPNNTLDINREENLRCASLLESKLFSRLAFSLAANMLHDNQDSAKNKNEAKLLQNILQNVSPESELDLDPVKRNLKYAHFFGLNFEHKLWTLLNSKNTSCPPLSAGYDFFCDKDTYLKRETDKSKLYLNRASADSRTRGLATARLLCMGQLEPAVKLLLETDPNDDCFLSDQFLACLISTTSTAVDCNQLSTTKLVATKLIAEGKLWEGVQLLCLVGKVWDACTYLRASKHWDETIWLAKLRLEPQEYLEICKKYSEFLISQGRHEEAALLHASNKNWQECLTVLHVGQFRSLALRLLDCLGEENLDPVLCEAVRLEGARFLFEVGHVTAGQHYAALIGDKGTELMSEYPQLF